MPAVRPLEPVTSGSMAPSAITWIDGRHAMVATMSSDGQISTCEINRGYLPEQTYLALVVRVIGDRQRTAILGPSSVRLALERDYVALFRHPDRLVDVEPADATEMPELVARLRRLAA